MTHTKTEHTSTSRGDRPSRAEGAGGRRLSLLFLVPLLAVLAALVAFFAVREERLGEAAQLSELKETAEAFAEEIAVARSWNAQHNGVYAEITAETRPNPYLVTPDRDLVSTGGKRLTKINPAYMTRELSQIADRRHGYKFRLVGLRPLNPQNAPEPWEKAALEAIGDRSAPAAGRVHYDEGAPFFNYLVPLTIEPACLSCHGVQGYRTGEVTGALVVRIPMERYDSIRTERIRKTVLSLSAVGGVGLLFSVIIALTLSRRLDREIRRNVEREKKIAAMELGGAAAHELRQPLTVLMCLHQVARNRMERGEMPDAQDMAIMDAQYVRMNEIIERMLNVMNYRTKEYLQGVRILDLEASSTVPGGGAAEGRR
jgi:hypothetical protein